MFFPPYLKGWSPRASPEHRSSAKQGWKGWSQASDSATKTSMFVYSRRNTGKRFKFFVDLKYISALSPNCSLKGQEQVVCKFYNELGRILVKDFPSVPQLEEIPGQVEDGDFSAHSHHEIGKKQMFSASCKGRWWMLIFIFELILYIINPNLDLVSLQSLVHFFLFSIW